jgi:uncharacterized membrane protein
MKKTENKGGVFMYFIGFIAIISMLISIIKNYQEVINQEFEVSTKVKSFQFIIQKLDSIGGQPLVYGLFALIALFFIYKLIVAYRSNSKTDTNL